MAKKRTLKLLSIVCAAAFFTGACGSGGGDASSDPSGSQQESAAEGTASGQAEETPSEESSESAANDQAADNGGLITLTTVVSLSDAMQQYIGVKDDVQTNNSWYNGYEKDLGIHVENLWSVPGTQYQDKLNAQISAGDIPDVFNVNSSQLKALVDNGMVMELTDLFEQNASDFTREMMEADDYTALEQCKMNGGLYAVGHWNEWFAGMIYMTDPGQLSAADLSAEHHRRPRHRPAGHRQQGDPGDDEHRIRPHAEVGPDIHRGRTHFGRLSFRAEIFHEGLDRGQRQRLNETIAKAARRHRTGMKKERKPFL